MSPCSCESGAGLGVLLQSQVCPLGIHGTADLHLGKPVTGTCELPGKPRSEQEMKLD